jgi:hypothetical protein
MAEATAIDPAARAQELLESLWNDSSLGSKVRAKAKEMYPDVNIPEDQFSPMIAPLQNELNAAKEDLAAMRAERLAEKEAREEASARSNLEDALAGARQKYNLTDEGFDKMVARMKETGNYADADASAAWVAQQTPAKTVNKADWLPRKINLFGSAEESEEADFKLLHINPLAYQDDQLSRFAADPDKYVAETFAA